MQDLSNSLRQRLSARPEPQEHPDLNLLTAFVERALPSGERNGVILHLSQCSQCREVVALTLAQPQPELQTSAPVFAGSRFWIAAFRWGGALAVLAVAITLMVEKPWKAGQTASHGRINGQELQKQHSPVSPASSSTQPQAGENASVSSSSEPSTVATPANPVNSEPVSTRRGVAEARAQAAPSATGAAAAKTAVVGGVMMAAKPVVVPPPSAVTVSSPRDYVNTNALKQDNGVDGNLVVDGKAPLPAAPGPQNGTQTKIVFPAFSLDNATSHAIGVDIAPPTTASSSAAPEDGNLSKSSFGSRLGNRIEHVWSGVKKATTPRSSAADGFLSAPRVLAAPNLKAADAEQQTTQTTPKFRITDGILMLSTDYTRWHEAYPQGPDLQFKVLLPKGEQVWAGGNNGTLIHSWNAGIDWEKLKVPDSGDITSITVDDGWQVKTSNGQTFVSLDSGKTWVPLQAEPK